MQPRSVRKWSFVGAIAAALFGVAYARVSGSSLNGATILRWALLGYFSMTVTVYTGNRHMMYLLQDEADAILRGDLPGSDLVTSNRTEDVKTMTPDEYLKIVVDRLHADGAEVTTEQIGGFSAVVGYRSKFRWRWIATRLHLFTIVVHEPVITAEGLAQFSEDALDYATSQKGTFRGIQNGVAAIPVQVGSQVSPAAVAAAESAIMRRFSAFAWPAIVDLSDSEVHSHQGSVDFGVVYASWMRQRTAAALSPDQADRN